MTQWESEFDASDEGIGLKPTRPRPECPDCEPGHYPSEEVLDEWYYLQREWIMEHAYAELENERDRFTWVLESMNIYDPGTMECPNCLLPLEYQKDGTVPHHTWWNGSVFLRPIARGKTKSDIYVGFRCPEGGFTVSCRGSTGRWISYTGACKGGWALEKYKRAHQEEE